MKAPELNQDYEKGELQYDLDKAARTNKFLLAIIIVFVLSSILLSIKIGSLQDKIGFMETDYKILLQICNGRE